MRKSNLYQGAKIKNPGAFHAGIGMSSREEV
jgi:hypothetical protein